MYWSQNYWVNIKHSKLKNFVGLQWIDIKVSVPKILTIEQLYDKTIN